MYALISNFLSSHSIHSEVIIQSVVLCALVALPYITGKLIKLFFIRWINRALARSESDLMPLFGSYNTVRRIFSLLPPLLILFSGPYILGEDTNPYYFSIWPIIEKLVDLYFVIIVGLLIDNIITVLDQYYQTFPISRRWPIKTYVQSFKILVYGVLLIFCISIISGKSPQNLLTALGAAGAVIMLIFKDSILSFVASIQISGANIMKVGDWIEIPADKISGTVEEISLNTIKVRNFDKTVSTIPPAKIVSTTIKNWAGMTDSGGRRFTPSLTVDPREIVPLTAEQIEKYRVFPELENFLKIAEKKPEKYTNLGAYRNYALECLRQDDRIHSKNGFTLLVRLLESNTYGYLPLQLYAFTKTTNWAEYEAIQSEIVEHLVSLAPYFSLKIMRAN